MPAPRTTGFALAAFVVAAPPRVSPHSLWWPTATTCIRASATPLANGTCPAGRGPRGNAIIVPRVDPERDGVTARSTAMDPAYRRLLGVFDEVTGQPIADAQVDDLSTGTSTATTNTGTMALSFADTSGILVRVRKLGYVPQLHFVASPLRDSTPITIVLRPAAQSLPLVVTRGTSVRTPADTVRKLELAGFYDRRMSTAAPSRAFVTRKQLNMVTVLSDLTAITARKFCPSNTYIDGMKVTMPVINMPNRTTKVFRDGIDALLTPDEVVGIEFYTISTVPAQYNATAPPGPMGVPPCGATLIWTR